MTSSFLGRRSRRDATSTTSPSRPRTRKNQPGRAKHSSMPRNSSPFGCSPECRGASLFGADDVVRSAWIRVQRGHERQEDGVWFPSIFGTEFRLTWAPVLLQSDVSISLENSGFKHAQVETRNGCGRGSRSISEMEVGNFDLPRFLEQNSADL